MGETEFCLPFWKGLSLSNAMQFPLFCSGFLLPFQMCLLSFCHVTAPPNWDMLKKVFELQYPSFPTQWHTHKLIDNSFIPAILGVSTRLECASSYSMAQIVDEWSVSHCSFVVGYNCLVAAPEGSTPPMSILATGYDPEAVLSISRSQNPVSWRLSSLQSPLAIKLLFIKILYAFISIIQNYNPWNVWKNPRK